jgi:hypothetical protein
MRMSTRFQTRLNASCTDDYVVVRSDDSAIRGVQQILIWYTPLPSFLPHLFTPLTIVEINHFSATHLFSCTYCKFCTVMTFDHDKFLPPFVKLSTSPACCTYFSSQYDGTHYNDNAQHGAWYNSTERTTLPLPGESQCTHLSTVFVHNDRQIDSAYFAQPMSHNSTYYTSPSLAHVCSDRPADSTRIVSYIRRQYVRTVPNVDIVGSSKCHARHLATGGVARFSYVLVTNSNPATTCASDGRVNPYPNIPPLK